MKRLLIAFAAIIALLIGPAAAQFTSNVPTPQPVAVGGPVGSPTIVNPPASGGLLNVGQAFSATLEPYINAAIQALLASALAWLSFWLKKKFDINITQGQRDTVQTWLTNQASSLIADGAVKVENGKVTVNQDALNAHAHQLVTQIPDAAKYFGLTPEAMAAKIVDKIPQVPAGAQIIAQSAAAPAPATAGPA